MLSIDISLMALSGLALVLLVRAAVKRGRLRLVFLSAGLFTALLALAAGISTEWAEALDSGVADRFMGTRTRRSFTIADSAFAFIGKPEGVALVAAVVGGLIASWKRSIVPLLLVMGGVATSVTVEHILKTLVGRTIRVDELGRPTDILVDYIHSYPSGHVAGSAALLGMIAVVLGAGRGRAAQSFLGIAVGLCVLAVAAMAIYVRAHLFSDVIGGMFLGGSIVSLGAVLLRVARETKVNGTAEPR